MTAFFVWCVNGKEIHKYLVHPYTILKCLNVVQMSIFNYIFIYFYFQEIFAVLGETLDINLEAKKILIDFHFKVTMSETLDTVAFVRNL